MMGRFMNGMIVGAGIALLVAPMRGVEMRALLRQRYIELRDALPEREQLESYAKQIESYARQVNSQVQQTTQTVRDLTRRSAKKAQRTGRDVAVTMRQGARQGSEYARSKARANG